MVNLRLLLGLVTVLNVCSQSTYALPGVPPETLQENSGFSHSLSLKSIILLSHVQSSLMRRTGTRWEMSTRLRTGGRLRM